jgi:hypothetical protein
LSSKSFIPPYLMKSVFSRSLFSWLAALLTLGLALPAFAVEKVLKVGFAQTGAESSWRKANTESLK